MKVHDRYNISAKHLVDGTLSQSQARKSARPSAMVTSLGVCKDICPFTLDPKETRCPAIEVVTWRLEVIYNDKLYRWGKWCKICYSQEFYLDKTK
jgi:hypothetical protein